MHRALRDEPHVVFFRDEQAGRTGICTTEAVKHGAMTLTNVMLREGRLCMLPVDQLVARDPQEARRRLRAVELGQLRRQRAAGRAPVRGEVQQHVVAVLRGGEGARGGAGCAERWPALLRAARRAQTARAPQPQRSRQQ
jgi:hypothetical protein